MLLPFFNPNLQFLNRDHDKNLLCHGRLFAKLQRRAQREAIDSIVCSIYKLDKLQDNTRQLLN